MIQFPPLQAILFDYGGTLDVPGRHWSSVLADAYKMVDVIVNRESFREAYVVVERILERENLISEEFTFLDVLRVKIRLQLEYLMSKGIVTYPSVEIGEKVEQMAQYCDKIVRNNTKTISFYLQNLKKNYQLALVSNFYGNLSKVLSDYQIDLFDVKVESAKVGVRKPNTLIWQMALDILKCSPEKALVIGDSLKNDIQPASVLGCHTLWLRGEGWENQPQEHSAAEFSTTSLIDALSIL